MADACTHVRGRCAILALSILLLLTVAAVLPRVAHATVARGIADPTLTQPGPRMDAAVQTEALDQVGPKLGAAYVRVVVGWDSAEPSRGVYDETYLAGVQRVVDLAHARGVRVIITFAYVPKWASNSYFWSHNPFKVKGYDRRYAMKTDSATLGAFQAFCREMATRFQVWGFECWNEPNLQMTLYPQSTAADRDYGAHVYLKMLRRFSVGVRQGDRDTVRLAGGTSPRGYAASAPLSTRRMMTSPQRFAKVIQAAKVGSLFDGYSHHPYTPGGAAQNWPEAPPRDPTTTVNLHNLGTLLRLFPSKPFYLTEYGYQTQACASFSGQFVSLAKQADYLRRAYAYAGRYRQVKVLMWFLLDDWSPPHLEDPYFGFYTGLRTAAQENKPAWFVFAGGNSLTLNVPDSASVGETVTLTGMLSSQTYGPIGKKTLVVQRRVPGGSWAKIGEVSTDESGTYTLPITFTKSASYRLTWPSVVFSPARTITVQ